MAKRRRPGPVPRFQDLTKRLAVRCSPGEYKRWLQHARSLGMAGVGTLLRKTLNESLAAKETTA